MLDRIEDAAARMDHDLQGAGARGPATATTCAKRRASRRPRTPEGCEECLRDGTPWVHLRLCLTCGHVGCCDSSIGKHASAHFDETAHPVMRSIEPGEAWRWCFVDALVG